MTSFSFLAAPDPDYEALETALGATARGRRFLAEHARRSQTLETRQLLEAVGRLERSMASAMSLGTRERLRADLADLAATVERARRDAAVGEPEDDRGLDALVRRAGGGVAAVIEAAERIQETAWTMREGGADPALCDALDARSTEIYAGCKAGESAVSALSALTRNLPVLDDRLRSIGRAWGIALGPDNRAALPPLDIDFVHTSPRDSEDDTLSRGDEVDRLA